MRCARDSPAEAGSAQPSFSARSASVPAFSPHAAATRSGVAAAPSINARRAAQAASALPAPIVHSLYGETASARAVVLRAGPACRRSFPTMTKH
ncbi:MAG: hypothetical protein DCC69_05080 [Hyphomicrobiales bacterium]|nr:MAG: hypothetical protein DCC69_05080 [Hyphomicrobiales bacterium]